MTIVEQILWRELRGKQLSGHRFRRQHPIGRYIADFACIEQQLVIELDGGQHQDHVTYDEHRTAYLLSHEWRVLRFWNNDVFDNLEGVLSTIVENFILYPHPNLPPARGKE
jgi:very-short-patch-repair endonuclease